MELNRKNTLVLPPMYIGEDGNLKPCNLDNVDMEDLNQQINSMFKPIGLMTKTLAEHPMQNSRFRGGICDSTVDYNQQIKNFLKRLEYIEKRGKLCKTALHKLTEKKYFEILDKEQKYQLSRVEKFLRNQDNYVVPKPRYTDVAKAQRFFNASLNADYKSKRSKAWKREEAFFKKISKAVAYFFNTGVKKDASWICDGEIMVENVRDGLKSVDMHFGTNLLKHLHSFDSIIEVTLSCTDDALELESKDEQSTCTLKNSNKTCKYSFTDQTSRVGSEKEDNKSQEEEDADEIEVLSDYNEEEQVTETQNVSEFNYTLSDLKKWQRVLSSIYVQTNSVDLNDSKQFGNADPREPLVEWSDEDDDPSSDEWSDSSESDQ